MRHRSGPGAGASAAKGYPGTKIQSEKTKYQPADAGSPASRPHPSTPLPPTRSEATESPTVEGASRGACGKACRLGTQLLGKGGVQVTRATSPSPLSFGADSSRFLVLERQRVGPLPTHPQLPPRQLRPQESWPAMTSTPAPKPHRPTRTQTPVAPSPTNLSGPSLPRV